MSSSGWKSRYLMTLQQVDEVTWLTFDPAALSSGDAAAAVHPGATDGDSAPSALYIHTRTHTVFILRCRHQWRKTLHMKSKNST